MRWIAMAVLAWLILAAAVAAQDSDLLPRRLRVEYLETPLAVHEPAPRLSWELTSARRNQHQSSYQVLVASTPELLAMDRGDLWDSGRVESDTTAHVEYRGRSLPSRQVCHWKVRAWDGDARQGAWSEPGRWEMGLLRPSDWSAKWIDAAAIPTGTLKVVRAVYQTGDGAVQRDVTEAVTRLIASGSHDFCVNNQTMGGDPAYGVEKQLVLEYQLGGADHRVVVAENASASLPAARLPALRKGFEIDKPVRRARLHATALGVYELRLNGRRVGDQHLAPGWTDYRKRVRYQTYDVTSELGVGKNVLGALVAPGWFSGHAGLFGAHRFYGQTPAMLVQLEVQFEDGSIQRVVSDETWRVGPTGTVRADLLKGEWHDAREDPIGWDRPDFDDGAWVAAAIRAEERTLEPDVSEPVKVLAELPARSVSEPAPRRWTFDLGQNMVGVVRLRIQAPAGTEITLRHAEILNADGTIYTQNLRAATSTDTYIARGDGLEEWRPRFTFHGFRYVELTGLKSAPPLEAVTGVVLGSAMPIDGTFECSDARLNQLQSNIVWGLRGNYLSIPTDCPQRDERMGWMADAQVFLPTATCNANVAAFMTKWMADVQDAQREDGAHSDVAPAMKGLTYGTPAWADSGSIVPWVMYEAYGDRRILERSAESMIRWVEWCREHSTNLIRDRDRGNDYGDWLSIRADTPKDLLGTAYFAHSTRILADTLRVLGRNDEANRYGKLFDDIKAAFIAKYVSGDGTVGGASDTQCAYVIALKFDLLPKELRSAAAERLVDDIRAKSDHLSTGFAGVSHLLPVLEEAGRVGVAYTLLLQDTFPSWLFSVRHGATTIWERWDGWTPETGPHPDWTMNSFNHYSLGSCGQWLFESVAGLAPDPSAPGFARAIIRPRVQGGLTHARASRRTMRGEYESGWQLADGRLRMDVTIPANARATVHVPAARPEDVRESGLAARESDGVRFIGVEAGAAVFDVGSGTYRFEVPLP